MELHKCILHDRLEKELDRLACNARDDNKLMWDDIKGKVPMKIFIWITGLVFTALLSLAGLQIKFAKDVHSEIEVGNKTMVELKVIQKTIKNDLEKIKIDK